MHKGQEFIKDVNATVDDMSTQIKGKDQKIDDMSTEIKDMSTEIKDKDKKIKDMSTEIKEMSTEIDDKNEKDKSNKKKIDEIISILREHEKKLDTEPSRIMTFEDFDKIQSEFRKTINNCLEKIKSNDYVFKNLKADMHNAEVTLTDVIKEAKEKNEKKKN